ncbi:hypothetical protein LSH36_187g02003 [Paralvinella palmiformis]|uniref:Protein kinase domain-containing protein n=1 Tax=Paralvinella palmiformis TaxID=53620 RepID=A0AAD9N6U5_9ANNE|nr:hypothetical protein LSH36_187g02003 [Paralvinella palmiformis]
MTLYCLVTEYASGGELLTYIKSQEGSRLTESAARPFIRQLVSALNYIHARNVVHSLVPRRGSTCHEAMPSQKAMPSVMDAMAVFEHEVGLYMALALYIAQYAVNGTKTTAYRIKQYPDLGDGIKRGHRGNVPLTCGGFVDLPSAQRIFFQLMALILVTLLHRNVTCILK